MYIFSLNIDYILYKITVAWKASNLGTAAQFAYRSFAQHFFASTCQ